jgi:hypothetical protein
MPMKDFVLAAMKLCGILFVAIGVFAFGGFFSAAKSAYLPVSLDAGVFFLAIGIFLFSAGTVLTRILGGKY